MRSSRAKGGNCMTVSELGINFRGRFEYLVATQRLCPELLSSLPETCKRGPEGPWPVTFAELQSTPEHRGCARAILEWARKHSVKDEWIWDAATQTVGVLGLGRWHYVPPSLPIPKFTPRFGVWLPLPII